MRVMHPIFAGLLGLQQILISPVQELLGRYAIARAVDINPHTDRHGYALTPCVQLYPGDTFADAFCQLNRIAQVSRRQHQNKLFATKSTRHIQFA